MLDIETMGVDHNAAIIQIAAVYFDPLTGETGEEFCRSIDLSASVAEGFNKNYKTMAWWAKQDSKILNEILEKGEPPRKVMYDFSWFVCEAKEIWSHTYFDFVLVQNYLKHFDCDLMQYKRSRDIRTLVELSGINLNKYDWAKKTHNALDDCKFQVEYCSEAIFLIKQGMLNLPKPQLVKF